MYSSSRTAILLTISEMHITHIISVKSVYPIPCFASSIIILMASLFRPSNDLTLMMTNDLRLFMSLCRMSLSYIVLTNLLSHMKSLKKVLNSQVDESCSFATAYPASVTFV